MLTKQVDTRLVKEIKPFSGNGPGSFIFVNQFLVCQFLQHPIVEIHVKIGDPEEQQIKLAKIYVTSQREEEY